MQGGGGKGKGGQKKGGSSIADLLKPKEPWERTEVVMQNLILVENHRRKVGSAILEDIEISEMAKALWEAPFAVLSHDKFENEDPVFTYANKAALDLFEATWDELVGMPSRKSAADEAEAQTDRNQILEAAAESGVIRNYTAWRQSLKGKRFQIKDATLFNLETPTEKKVGQATTIYHWVFEDGTEGGPAASPPVESTERPSDEEIKRAEESVQEQADLVRALKEEHGLGNDDEEVQENVALLLRRKAKLEALQRRLVAAEAAAAAAESESASPAA
ncbi:g4071 [Coccomyxa elongata]